MLSGGVLLPVFLELVRVLDLLAEEVISTTLKIPFSVSVLASSLKGIGVSGTTRSLAPSDMHSAAMSAKAPATESGSDGTLDPTNFSLFPLSLASNLPQPPVLS